MALTQISTQGIKDGTISSADLADQSVTLAKLPHGTSSNDGKFLRANNGADPTFETVSSIGGSTGVDFDDNVKARFGTGNDLEIYHSGSHNYLVGVNSGQNTYIGTNSGSIQLQPVFGVDHGIIVKPNDAVELYYDGSKKFETTSYGAAITSSGTSHGLKIFHSNGNEVASLTHGGSGDEGALILKDSGTSTVVIRGENGQDIDITTGGNFDLEHDSAKLRLGASNDLQIYHDGSHSYITRPNGSDGQLLIRANHSDNGIVMNNDGAVELYHDGSKKFETISSGVQVSGTLFIPDGGQASNRISIGNSGDLQIYHDGSNSYIKNTGTGNLYIDGDTDDLVLQAGDDVRIQTQGNENAINCVGNGAVELYYDNSKKFETTSAGATLTGALTTTGNINVPTGNGIVTGSVTTTSSTALTAVDNGIAYFGTGLDLRIFHDGSHSYVKTNTGDLRLESTSDDIKLLAQDDVVIRDDTDTITMAQFIQGGAVELYHNNSKKFETTSTGSKITGSDMTVIATEGISAGLYLIADEGDDNGDGWRLNSNQDANDLTIANNINGSYADKLTLTKEGNISVSGSGLSDRDLKDNIATVTTTALDKIKQLVPKTFTWKKYDNNRTFTGFIAQDVESVLPILVNGTDGEKNMSLDYNGILAYAVKAITELSAEVETLKTKVATLEAS